jgi:cytochrome c
VNRPVLSAAIGALLLIIPISPALAETEAGAAEPDGQVEYNNACRTCHSMKPGDNRLGPTLHGVVGRKAGTVEGFAFSSAMKSSRITWDEATLDKFITNPEAVVSGNGMKPFGGIDSAEDRAKIIGYMKTLK